MKKRKDQEEARRMRDKKKGRKAARAGQRLNKVGERPEGN